MASQQNGNSDSILAKENTCYYPVPNPQMGHYKGDSLNVFMKHHLKYPVLALENGVSGKVYVSFVVMENGEISNVKVLRGIGYGCDEEAIRLIKLTSGNWWPTTENGRLVKVYYNMPLQFQLK